MTTEEMNSNLLKIDLKKLINNSKALKSIKDYKITFML